MCTFYCILRLIYVKMLLYGKKEVTMRQTKQIDVSISSAIGFEDISPLFFGHESCASLHSFGPYVRDYYLVHFCLAGRGVLEDKYGRHEISAGELFVIRPGEVTLYSADRLDPWEYIWIAFKGRRAEMFDFGASVIAYPEDTVERLCELIDSEMRSAYAYLGIIYELIHRLFPDIEEAPDRLAMIKRYIKYNYMKPITIAELSSAFGLERSYMFRIFKRRYGVGVKEFITKTRMEKATAFLKEGYSVSETSHMVGYADVFNFSKAYKRYFGISPSQCTV